MICEGRKTECIYFEGIRTTYRMSTANVRVVGLGADPSQVVREAIGGLSEYDQVWCVFDVEAPQPHARLHEAVELATARGVRCGISNPCFEFWLILHFLDHTAYLDNVQARRLLTACGCGYSDKGFDFA